MNFYNDDEKKAGAPVIPGAASPFKKTSAFGKPAALARMSGSIVDRLKNLSRRDLTLVGVGLSILVMAPVAEYMISQPESASMGSLEGTGFGTRDGKAPTDNGYGGLSAGSTDGAGEVITPLSFRDPASLILGSQPAQPPAPAVSAPPPQTNWRDSVKDAARESFSAATKAANPTSIPKMGGALRSMSSFYSGGEGSRTSSGLSGGKIIADAQGASRAAAKRSMVGPVAPAGYKGVASNTPNSASKGAFEKLRGQADKSAGYFSGGSAMGALDKAAAEAVNVGAGGGGAGGLGDGSATKGGAPNSGKGYDRNISPKETLAEMAAKQRMQKALEWEFFKKYEIPKQIINAVVGEVSKWIAGQVSGVLNGPGSGPTEYVCASMLDTAKGCVPGNLVAGIRTRDAETVKGWISNKSCPCGPIPAKEFTAGNPAAGNPAAGNPAAGNPAAGNPAAGNPSPVQHGQVATQAFKDYDSVLRTMLADAQAGVATDNAVTLLDKSIAVAENFANLRADRVATEVNTRTAAVGIGEVSEYSRSISDARTKVEAVKTDYRMFRAQFNNTLAAAQNNTLAGGTIGGTAGGPSHSAQTSQSVLPYLLSAKETLDQYEGEYIGKADKRIAFHTRAIEVYRAQLGYVTASANGVKEAYLGDVLSQSRAIQQELNALKSGLAAGAVPNAEQTALIKEKFKALSGLDSKVQAPVAPAASPTSSLPPSDLRTAVSDSAATGVVVGGLLEKPVKWRGLAQPPYDGEKANSTDTEKAEGVAWSETTPANKGNSDPTAVVNLDNLNKECLLAAMMRGTSEIPTDVKGAVVDPTAAAALMDPVKKQMDDVRKQMAEWKIDMGNPTGTAAGATPAVTPSTPSVTTPVTAPVNVTVNVQATSGANVTTQAAAVAAAKPKPKPTQAPAPKPGIDSQRAAAMRTELQVRNQAIQDARREMDAAVSRARQAKAAFDAAYNTCNSRCSGVWEIAQDACWAGCKLQTGFDSKNRAFDTANTFANGRITFVQQKKSECAAFMNTVPANYRPSVGACMN